MFGDFHSLKRCQAGSVQISVSEELCFRNLFPPVMQQETTAKIWLIVRQAAGAKCLKVFADSSFPCVVSPVCFHCCCLRENSPGRTLRSECLRQGHTLIVVMGALSKGKGLQFDKRPYSNLMDFNQISNLHGIADTLWNCSICTLTSLMFFWNWGSPPFQRIIHDYFPIFWVFVSFVPFFNGQLWRFARWGDRETSAHVARGNAHVGELGGFGDVVIWRWDIMGIYIVYIYNRDIRWGLMFYEWYRGFNMS